MTKHSVADDGDPRKYYAAIPNIVLTLGLHPFELALYAYLKKVAGEGGVCWKSRATIARETKMSAGMVTKCKEVLARPRQELNGKPLIVVTEQMQNGGNANHSITITDIWPENMVELERVRLEKARSCSDGDNLTRSPYDARGHTVTATRSPHDHKEEPIKKNPEESLVVPFRGREFLDALTEFEAHRCEMRKPLKPIGRKRLYQDLSLWGEESATEALRQAVRCGYQGVFEPKRNTSFLYPEHPNAHRPGKVIT